MFTKASHYFLVSGASDGYSELNAFDQALLAAGVGDTNLVRMSSILPPGCQQIEPVQLPYGDLVPVAYGSLSSSEAGMWLSAAVAVAIPADPQFPGLIMEEAGFARKAHSEARAREMAAHGMAHRNREIRTIIVRSVEWQVQQHGCAFAGVVLWKLPEGERHP